jgi:DAACS family dicarboxylate/amino acid:cation (Na+ or H+) symporter
LEESAPAASSRGFISWWHSRPLYIRIIWALALGVAAGLTLQGNKPVLESLELVSKLILRLMGALAPPLILVAVIQALLHAEIKGRVAGRLISLLVLNTLVAILIGLFVANTLRPGQHIKLPPPARATEEAKEKPSPIMQFIDNVPKSVAGPLTDQGSVIGVIFIAVAFGIALRRYQVRPITNIGDLIDLAFDMLLVVLHWIIDIIPIGVFGIVAGTVGKHGFGAFKSLGFFVLAVICALTLQATYYLLRIRFWTWVRPLYLLRHGRDALVMAFSTASSTATMPVTFACLREKARLREESASMGALVGSNFNNDGTALYEAMSALFIAQMIGQSLSLQDQFLVVLTSILASVGAAGIPEAGLVTMTLVFRAVHLPTEYIPLLLTVDWFLDRCRTTINVMGDMNVSCLLDGRTPEQKEALGQDV